LRTPIVVVEEFACGNVSIVCTMELNRPKGPMRMVCRQAVMIINVTDIRNFNKLLIWAGVVDDGLSKILDYGIVLHPRPGATSQRPDESPSKGPHLERLGFMK